MNYSGLAIFFVLLSISLNIHLKPGREFHLEDYSMETSCSTIHRWVVWIFIRFVRLRERELWESDIRLNELITLAFVWAALDVFASIVFVSFLRVSESLWECLGLDALSRPRRRCFRCFCCPSCPRCPCSPAQQSRVTAPYRRRIERFSLFLFSR